jgi:hypothetical protein
MPTADAAGKFTVFNIKGNRLRLRKPVTLLLEILNQQRQQLCQYQTGRVSSGDDDASNQDIVGVGERFAAAFHLLEAKVDGFADIGEGLGDGLALRVTAGDGGADHDVAAIVLIGSRKTLKSRVVMPCPLAVSLPRSVAVEELKVQELKVEAAGLVVSGDPLQVAMLLYKG